MHGRIKTRSTAEQQEAKRKEREKKVKLYKAGIGRLFQKRCEGSLDNEALELSAQLLSANPDIYTVWNIRREAILHFKTEQSSEEFQQLLENELPLTEQCLRVNPKSYCAWHHRAWVQNNMPVPNWKRELALCNKYLELDERNFHTWHYRQYVVSQAKVPAEDEFSFSTEKISSNFSNYSSWHYRSKLLPIIFPDPLGKRPIREDKHKEELTLVLNATFTDPNDQSAWFYQRWLLGRAYQDLALAQAYVSKDLLFAVLTKSVRIVSNGKMGPRLELYIANNPVEGSWQPSLGNLDSHVWIFEPEPKLSQDFMHGPVEVVLHDNDTKIDQLSLIVKENKSEAFYSKKPVFDAEFSQSMTSVLESELESYCELLDMEPDSKWTLLTIVLLMQAIDRNQYKDDTMQKLRQLVQVDRRRIGYYSDLKSRYEIEYALDNQEKEDLQLSTHIEVDLSGRNLTALYHLHYLSLVKVVDLSNNQLTSRSLPQLHALQCCEVLNLDGNIIHSLNEIPLLPFLHKLSAKNNKISSRDGIKALKNFNKLITVSLNGNPIEEEGIEEYLKELLQNTKS